MTHEDKTPEQRAEIERVAQEILVNLKEKHGVNSLSEIHSEPPIYLQPEFLLMLVGFLIVSTMIIKGVVYHTKMKKQKALKKEEREFREDVRGFLSKKK